MRGVWSGVRTKEYAGMPAEMCPFCGWLQHPIQVAGHVQCGHCRQVLESCCTGETQQISDESSREAENGQSAVQGIRSGLRMPPLHPGVHPPGDRAA